MSAEFPFGASLSPELLALLRCPLTLQRLRVARADELARASPPLDAGLIREDESVIYPIRDGLPILLPEEAVAISK